MFSMLLITTNFHDGGAEKFCKNLVCALQSHEVELTVLIIYEITEDEKSDLRNISNLIVLNKKRLKHGIREIISLIRRENFDLTFTSLPILNFVLCVLKTLKLFSGKLVCRETVVLTKHFDYTLVAQLKKYIYSFICRKADLTISQSNDMTHDLVKKLNFTASKVVQIPNPIFRPSRYKFVNSRNFKSKKSNTEFKFIWIGRLEKQKGCRIMLDAVRSTSDYKIHVHVLGVGTLERELKTYANHIGISNKVSFNGWQKEVGDWLIKSDALIVSSLYEGMPNVMLESIAHNTPVICLPAKGGINEIKNDFSEYVYLAKQHSAQALALELHKYCKLNPDAQAIFLPEKYNPDTIFNHYFQKFKEVTSRY